MSRTTKLIILIIPFSLLMGMWWGLRGLEHRLQSNFRQNKELKILYRKGSLPPQLFSDFTTHSGLQIVVTSKESDFLLWEELKERPSNYDILQVYSYFAKEAIGSKIFAELNYASIPHLSKVSVDFSHLPYDPQFRYLLPIFWGLNGYLWNQDAVGWSPSPSTSIVELLDNQLLKGKVYALPLEFELLSLMQKTGYLLKEPLEQQNWDNIFETTLKFVNNKIRISPLSSKYDWIVKTQAGVVQMSNGSAANILKQMNTLKNNSAFYWLPEDKSNLWVSLLGISKSSSMSKEAHEFLSYLLEDSTIQMIIQFNEQATAIEPSRIKNIHPMQLPKYLRTIPLNKIEMLTESPSLNSGWQRNLVKALPNYFFKEESK